ncbi:hypothetical protein ACFWOB_25440 [Streptomyces sp. NPDC058420]|uniref:fused DSP-PTPase phosphatase/NAD kinase-like protein n=1 Tax=Streptomyces sp. NPDC058420 TaxID=3346489 RepID=UPI00365E826C
MVATVGGWAAADLRLLGAAPPRRRGLALLNPAPGARRLGAAWRVGRLAAALPGLAADLVAVVDRGLAQVPACGELPLPRRAMRLLLVVALGYVALWATGALRVLALSYWAREETPAPPGTRTVQGIRHLQPVHTEGRSRRGAAPSPGGYRELARLGFTTDVDLRAEDLTSARLAEPRRAGLDVVRLPIRDGQTPTPVQVQRFLEVVASAAAPVFVHCEAGVAVRGRGRRRISCGPGRCRPRGRSGGISPSDRRRSSRSTTH